MLTTRILETRTTCSLTAHADTARPGAAGWDTWGHSKLQHAERRVRCLSVSADNARCRIARPPPGPPPTAVIVFDMFVRRPSCVPGCVLLAVLLSVCVAGWVHICCVPGGVIVDILLPGVCPSCDAEPAAPPNVPYAMPNMPSSIRGAGATTAPESTSKLRDTPDSKDTSWACAW